MKRLHPALIIPAIILALVGYMFYYLGFFGGLVRNEVREVPDIIAPSGHAYVTYVWLDGEIVASEYDDVETLTDSLVDTRRAWGKQLLKTLNR